ncbi:uncharacterized protein Dana_GF27237 [Drosophila ananassae]|uniref:VM domain-containing protein n=1 Tax=Drosophila ananassae TaxID=7217 RepID=A0A0P8XYA4_DROAN|nr:uncharacterized protein LOC26514646 [Drosophila ananassae]KPU79599.1 uncharacterized protein Dana_GF27237 [Drosophila ananassae]
MKFSAVLLLLCALIGYTMASTTTTSAQAFTSTSTSAPVAPPCGGPQGPCGQLPQIPPCAGGAGGPCAKKLYFFY